MAFRKGLRHENFEKEITRFQIGATDRGKVSGRQRDIWRQRVFRGEYHLFDWSQLIVLESPNIGYAPLENQIKQWAKESRIEGWFPHLGGEYKCCNVIGCAKKKLTDYRNQTRYAWFKLKVSCVSSHQSKDVNQSARLVAADAGCKTKCVHRTGKLRLDTLPHRRTNKRLHRGLR